MYRLQCSPLYGLSSKKKLCRLLGSTPSEIKRLQTLENYKFWTQKAKNGKRERPITEPKPYLKRIQKKLQILLSRIEKPQYLCSGIKGMSHIDNAIRHLGQGYVLNLDIKGFYENCSKEYVFRLFYYTFRMPEDLAWTIANLTTLDDALPTGSPSSQLVAFFAYKGAFDAIYDLAQQNGIEFSLFVDDMTFSSPRIIPDDISGQCENNLKKVGHTIKRKKTKRFFPRDFKIVTGVALSPCGMLKVRNQHRDAIIRDFIALKRECDENPKRIRSLMGRIQAARQVEPDIFTGLYKDVIQMARNARDQSQLACQTLNQNSAYATYFQ